MLTLRILMPQVLGKLAIASQVGTVALYLAACTSPPVTPVARSPIPLLPSATPSPVQSTASPPPAAVPSDSYEKGRDRAASARSLAETAQTPEDWALVLNRWQQAIVLMQSIPPTSAQRSAAQTLAIEYQRAFVQAQQQSRTGRVLPNPSPQNSSVEDGIPLAPGPPPSARQANALARLRILQQKQQEFLTTQKRFAASLAELDATLDSVAEGYAYRIQSTPQRAIATATAQKSDLLSYAAAVFVIRDKAGQPFVVEGICMSKATTQVPLATPRLVNNQVQCGTGAVPLEGGAVGP
jgi:Type IV pilin-like G and H, putative